VRDQVWQIHKTTCQVMMLYILIFKVLERRRETKNSEQNDSKYFANLIFS
jgi:hypothetical protein